jgi:hypothetical protein
MLVIEKKERKMPIQLKSGSNSFDKNIYKKTSLIQQKFQKTKHLILIFVRFIGIKGWV